jgi:hypothetical protein
MFAGGDPETGRRYLEKQGFEAQRHGEGFNYSIRKPGETEWRSFDPAGFDLEDITDISGDVLSLAGTGLGAAMGAPAGIAGLAAGGAAGAGGAQALRTGVGGTLGLRPTLGEAAGGIGEEAVTGALAGPLGGLMGAAGRGVGRGAGKLLGAGKDAGKYVKFAGPGKWERATRGEVAKGLFGRGGGKFARSVGGGRFEPVSKGKVAIGALGAGALRAAPGAAVGAMLGGVGGGLLGGGMALGGRGITRRVASVLMGDTTGGAVKTLLKRAGTSAIARKLQGLIRTLETRGETAYRAASWVLLQQPDIQKWLRGLESPRKLSQTRGRRPTVP